MKHWIWISFDLGVKGDYEGMYKWLDKHKAVECGDSLAGMQYEHENNLLFKCLTKDIAKSVELTNKSRIYVIRREGSKMKGKFIFGGRKSPPWSGYAGTEDQGEDTSD